MKTHKIASKMTLSRETLRNLDSDQARHVVGGNFTFTCPAEGCTRTCIPCPTLVKTCHHVTTC
jgi:hypothetical protein